MKIGEYLYFAPGLSFVDLDLSATALPGQYIRRIEGFYLEPAEVLAQRGHGFGAGVLLLCAIDALGKVEFPASGVGERFKQYSRERLASFSNADYARQLYEAFRCGVVHEARAKDGAEISLESGNTVEPVPGGIQVNPAGLLLEVRGALHTQMQEIEGDDGRAVAFKDYITEQFSEELAGIIPISLAP
ncbi:MAG: hypothetical protein LC541_18715 [Candidatus Thiodiazotropha sp.]|nr:hypothetical protein [Candidatus Thiodiazotropha sp.]MCM8885301.1 hypothetical protein [Candidatus Thiodiazotropha sp.]MCM8921564.1 hypothetical protein [Candidatus Thiodiazotropha sp.]